MAKTTTIRPASHQEWLLERAKGIGSSEVGTILGLNPWETPYQLWRRRTGLDPQPEENFAMRAGHFLEDAVAQFFAYESGHKIIKRSADEFIIKSSLRPYLQCSPDRTFWLSDTDHRLGKGILECKTTQMKIDADHLPLHWVAQLTYQMGVAGINSGALAWLTAGREFGYRTIEFDPEFFSLILSRLDEFWHTHLMQHIAPADTCAADTLLRYPQHTEGQHAVADSSQSASILRIKELKAQEAQLAAERAQIEDGIKAYMAQAESLVSQQGITLATWRAPKPSQKLDTERLAKEHPAIAASYYTPVQTARRFLIK